MDIEGGASSNPFLTYPRDFHSRWYFDTTYHILEFLRHPCDTYLRSLSLVSKQLRSLCTSPQCTPLWSRPLVPLDWDMPDIRPVNPLTWAHLHQIHLNLKQVESFDFIKPTNHPTFFDCFLYITLIQHILIYTSLWTEQFSLLFSGSPRGTTIMSYWFILFLLSYYVFVVLTMMGKKSPLMIFNLFCCFYVWDLRFVECLVVGVHILFVYYHIKLYLHRSHLPKVSEELQYVEDLYIVLGLMVVGNGIFRDRILEGFFAVGIHQILYGNALGFLRREDVKSFLIFVGVFEMILVVMYWLVGGFGMLDLLWQSLLFWYRFWLCWCLVKFVEDFMGLEFVFSFDGDVFKREAIYGESWCCWILGFGVPFFYLLKWISLITSIFIS